MMYIFERLYFSYGHQENIESRSLPKDRVGLIETSAGDHNCNNDHYYLFHVTSHPHPHPLSSISDMADVQTNVKMSALFNDVTKRLGMGRSGKGFLLQIFMDSQIPTCSVSEGEGKYEKPLRKMCNPSLF